MNFWLALLFTSVICMLIKVLAIVAQQKGFGEGMGRLVSVRKLVGVNSVPIRAIKMILEVPGINIKKVCILCGGPDWPTSVLTGILHLSLWEMIKGSLPVFFLIAPTCMSSGLLLRSAEGAQWVAIGNLMLTVASMTQGGTGLCAAYFINQTADKNAAELEAMPDDEEVKKMEQRDAMMSRRREHVSDWHASHRDGSAEEEGKAAVSGEYFEFGFFMKVMAGG
jgi:hypothetical protein